MLKEDFRALDQKPGMRFRLIRNGKTGTAKSFFKDSVMLELDENTKEGVKNITFCPCEMLELPIGEWSGKKYKLPDIKKEKKVCKNCGKEFLAVKSKNQKYCSRECYLKYKQKNRGE